MTVPYKYLYIHQFDWLNPNASLDFNGEPKKNSVYRAEDYKTFYRVILSENQEYIGFHLEKKSMVGEFDSWECEVEEVNAKNLLELGISNKDLSMMAEGESSYEVEEEDLEKKLLDDLGEAMFMLNDFDSDAYEAMAKTVTMVSDAISNPTYISLTEEMSWDARTAKNTNISITAHLLESYINSKNELKISDLLDAIYQLMIEIIRVHKIAKINAGI